MYIFSFAGYFVLAEKEQATFEVLTAIAVNHGLIMQLENKNPHFAVSRA